MNRHKFHDGRGEVRIYSALPGCSCEWCQSQRRAEGVTKLHAATGKEAGDLLAKYATELMKRDKVLTFSAAFRKAAAQYPAVFELYSGTYTEDGRDARYAMHGPGLAGIGSRMEEAGRRLDEIARGLQHDNPKLSYKECLLRAIADNPDLAADYNGVTNIHG